MMRVKWTTNESMLGLLVVFCSLGAISCAGDGEGLDANGDPIAPNQKSITISLTASKDNTLYERPTGDRSNGAGDHMFAGTTSTASQGAARRALIAFDLSAIPAGSTIESAELTLYMSRAELSGSEPVTVHRVLMDWGEGTSAAGGEEGGGAPSTTGDATWIHTFYDSGTWTTPGGDFVAAESATQTVGAVGFYTWTDPGLAGDVQAWMDNGGTNFGWIIIGNETTDATAKRFDSRTVGNTDRRPELLITYTPGTTL